MDDVISYLRERIHNEFSVRVPESVPAKRPSEFVMVVRNGGGWIDGLRDGPRVDIHCWADSEDRARELSDGISRMMRSLNKNVADGFLSCKETTRRRDPDPDSDQPRWYGSYLINTFNY